jgi:hypothetical protein
MRTGYKKKSPTLPRQRWSQPCDMFGKYPQEFLPQIMITFVQYYGTTEEEKTPQGARLP